MSYAFVFAEKALVVGIAMLAVDYEVIAVRKYSSGQDKNYNSDMLKDRTLKSKPILKILLIS